MEDWLVWCVCKRERETEARRDRKRAKERENEIATSLHATFVARWTGFWWRRRVVVEVMSLNYGAIDI